MVERATAHNSRRRRRGCEGIAVSDARVLHPVVSDDAMRITARRWLVLLVVGACGWAALLVPVALVLR